MLFKFFDSLFLSLLARCVVKCDRHNFFCLLFCVFADCS